METVRTFDCVLRSESVTLQFGDKKENCTIREMMGDDLEAFLDENAENIATTTEESKAKTPSKYKGMFVPMVRLLKRCLYGEDGAIIAQERIEALPPRIKQALYKIAQRVNDFGQEDGKNAVPN